MPSRSIVKTLRYNEEKLTEKKAECILAVNFLKDADKLTFEDKLHRLERRMQLNEDVITNPHITLNFDPLDQLSDKKMQEIAKVYMKEIGFEHQPYLVYRHHDSGHPHCHIVTTHVQRNGEPIVMYNMGRNQSEQARLRIETEFHLMTKEKKQQLRQQDQNLRGVPRVTYGQGSTTRGVSNVLGFAMEYYKYTSLEEFNAVLRLYNVEAYRGKEQTKLYQHRGLLYRVLDKDGKYIGVPLKASFFDSKPTLDRLEQKFAQNLELKQKEIQHIKTHIHWELYQKPESLKDFHNKLAGNGIAMVLRNKQDLVHSLHFVHFSSGTILSEKDLDEHTNRQRIQEVIIREQTQTTEQTQRQVHRHRLRL
jgi:hypothetical protein